MPRNIAGCPRREGLTRLSPESLPTGVLTHARRLAKLRDRLAAILDETEAAHFVGVSLHANRLVLFADSSLWCTRLRYRAAQFEVIAEALLGRRPQLNFKVQPPVFRARATPRRALPQAAVKCLEAAARSVEDEALAAALRRLAGRQS